MPSENNSFDSLPTHAPTHAPTDPPPHGVTVYHNATIFTSNRAQPWATALAIQGDRILAVGDADQVARVAGTWAQHIDLHGKFVMPGLCDSHIHLYDLILARQNVRLNHCRSLSQMLATIRSAADTQSERRHSENHAVPVWLRGQGWNESQWEEPRFPTRTDLETAIPRGVAAIFWRTDLHVAVCNQTALDLAGIARDTADPPGGKLGRDENGEPNGLLFDTAINLVTRHLPILEGAPLEQAILEIGPFLHQLGITAIHDQRLQSGEDGQRMVSAYLNLQLAARQSNHADEQQPLLPVRIHTNIAGAQLDHAIALGLRSGFGNDWLRFGHVKFFIDGSLGSRTAWMLEPFTADDPTQADSQSENRGLCVTDPRELYSAFRKATLAGLSISVHAIGDRANREVLDIFTRLHAELPGPTIPHRIEHVQIIHPTDTHRLAELNLTASVQPIHALDDIEIGHRYLGDRKAHAYTFRDLHQSGVRLVFGSDAPVADPNPFLGIHAAVMRYRTDNPQAVWLPDQAIDLETALRAYTIGPALAVGSHQAYGSLEAGKLADFVVLAQNPFDVLAAASKSTNPGTQSTPNLAEITVKKTVIGGRTLFER